jgi:hypothetical protein
MGTDDVFGKDSGVVLSGCDGSVAHQLLDDVGRQSGRERIGRENTPKVMCGKGDSVAVDAREPGVRADSGEYAADIASGNGAGRAFESFTCMR